MTSRDYRYRRRRAILIAGLVLALGALAGAGCGGDEDTAADTETTVLAEPESAVTATTAVETGDEAVTDTSDTATPGTDGDAAATDDPFASFEVLDALPDDYPDLELPPDTELLEARGGELDPGTGEMVYVTVAAYDSQTPAPDQYEHWKQYFADAGYRVVMDQMFEEPVYTFILEVSDSEHSITVIGGDDDSEFIAEFPDAQHPFALVVAPAFLSE